MFLSTQIPKLQEKVSTLYLHLPSVVVIFISSEYVVTHHNLLVVAKESSSNELYTNIEEVYYFDIIFSLYSIKYSSP